MLGDVPFYDLGAVVRARRAAVLDAVNETIDSGQFIGGSAVEEFEEGFAAYVGAQHCVAVGNGLDGLRIALECAGVGPGDEVLVPGFTFYATWLAVLQVGARPVPVDVRMDTASIDPAKLEGAVSARTKAILPVHLYGIPADISEISANLDSDRGILVLEDAAQAHGARGRDGRLTGSLGDLAAFSFYPTKNLGALGDAGAIVTSDARWAEIARSRRSYGQGATKYEHIDTGWNSRMDPLQARILIRSLAHLDADNARRREIATSYREALADAATAVVGDAYLRDSVWHHFVVRATNREALRVHLQESGIATDVHYPYAFDDLEPTRSTRSTPPELHAARRLSRSVVSLPIGVWMTDGQIDRVTEALRELPRRLLAVD